MKKLVYLLINIVALIIPGTVCWMSIADHISGLGVKWPAVFGALAVFGNVLLWFYASREHFRPRAWFALKSLLFNSGWILLFGIWSSAVSLPSSSFPATAGRSARSASAEAMVIDRMRDLEDRMARAGDKAGEAQIRGQRKALEDRFTRERAHSGLPPFWRWFLMASGGIAALVGLGARDEWVMLPLFKVFPKSQARRLREEANEGFRKTLQLIRERKVEEAVPFLVHLDTHQLSPSLRADGEFFQACASVHSGAAERVINQLVKLQRADPECREYAYVLAYSYLYDKKPASARPLLARIYKDKADYLETKLYYSYAAYAEADELRRKGDIAGAMQLYKIVQDLGIHSGNVPENMENEQLMAAVAKMTSGDPKDADATFERIETEGVSKKKPDLAAFAKAGRGLVAMKMGRAPEARHSFRTAAAEVSKHAGITLPQTCPEAKLFEDLDDAPAHERESKAVRSGPEHRYLPVLRDLFFLEGVAQLTAWSGKASAEAKTELVATLHALRRSLQCDAHFADSRAIYGMLLFFRGPKKLAALSYLESARRAGFDHPAASALLQVLRKLAKAKAQTKTELMERLDEYLTNPEVRKALKQQLLQEEEIRTGYSRKFALDGMAESEPSVAELVKRTSRLAEDLSRILSEWEAAGERPEKIDQIKQALDMVTAAKKRWVDERNALEEHEAKLVRAAGLFALSEDF
jgi:hypothetical protein